MAKAKVKPAAGMGVSITKESITDEQLNNLKKLVASKATLIKKAIGTQSLEIVTDGENVIFPWWDESRTAEEVHAFTVFVEKLKDMAVKQERVNAKEVEVENEKYAFRCFLLRLGFIGDKYKSDRKILLKNFTGSSSNKNTQKKAVAVLPAESEKIVEEEVIDLTDES